MKQTWRKEKARMWRKWTKKDKVKERKKKERPRLVENNIPSPVREHYTDYSSETTTVTFIYLFTKLWWIRNEQYAKISNVKNNRWIEQRKIKW